MKYLPDQKGAIPVLLLVAAIGVITFLAITSIAAFKNDFLASLFPKPRSQAASCQIPDNRTPSGPIIFNPTESATPGEVVGLQGDRFGANPEVWMSKLDSSSSETTPQYQLTPFTKSDDFVGVRVPSNIGMGLYAFWVKNGTVLSNPVMVNQSRVTSMEFDEVASGNAFRLFGRNLSLSGVTPKVYFVPQSGGSEMNATVVTTGSDAYVLKVNAPTGLVDGISYDVYVSNGYGGCFGEKLAEESIKGRNGATDSFNLGVPWGADFTFSGNIRNVKTQNGAIGNGVADDQAAIQSAIDAQAVAGGVVYLPAGTYRLGGSGLTVKSKVVLKGDGIGQTFIKYGDSTTGTALTFSNQNIAGVIGMSIQNTSSQKTWYGAKAVNANKIFIKDVNWDFGDPNIQQSDTQWIGKNFLVSGVTFNHNNTREPFTLNRFDNTSYLSVLNSTFNYIDGRLWIGNYNDHFVFDTNQVYQNGDLNTPNSTTTNEDGGIDTYISNMVILNNTFALMPGTNLNTADPMINTDNDGETVLTQLCDINALPGMNFGTATGSSSTTLVDSTKTFSNVNNRYFLAIVDGPGVGQVRKVTSASGNTINIASPWEINPTTASKYVLKVWSADGWLVKGNNFTNLKRGIWMYCSTHDSAIVGNTLDKAEGIFLQSDFRSDGKRYELQWNNLVADNLVKGSANGKPTHITMLLAQNASNSQNLPGIGGLKNEFRRNTIQGSGQDFASKFSGNIKEGFENWVLYEGTGGPISPDTDTPGILGSIFEDNVLNNLKNGYKLSTGVWQTTIADSSNTAVTNLVTLVGTPVDTVQPAPAGTVTLASPSPTLAPSQPPASPSPTGQAPFSGSPISIPGKLEVENYDNGGEGVAYHDLESLNKGNQYGNTFRTTEGVDTQATTDTGGGVNIAWATPAEWLEYSVNIAATGSYTMNARVALDSLGGTFHIEEDGVDKTGPLTVPNTGGVQTWQNVTKTGMNLTAGNHILRIVMDTAGTSGYVGNFNYLDFSQTLSLPGDIIQNNKVDIFDYNALLSDFGKTSNFNPLADIVVNGRIDIFDYNSLLGNFGRALP